MWKKRPLFVDNPKTDIKSDFFTCSAPQQHIPDRDLAFNENAWNAIKANDKGGWASINSSPAEP